MARGDKRVDMPKAKLSKESISELLFIYKYIKPYKRFFVLGFMFVILSGVSTMAFPYLLKQLIDSANPATKSGLSSLAIAAIMFLVLLIQVAFSYGRINFLTLVGENSMANMRQNLYKVLITKDMQFFSNHRVGELSSRISADLNQIQDAVSFVFAEVLRGILTLFIGIGLLFFISSKLTLVMLSVIPIIVVIAIFFGRYIKGASRLAQDRLAESNVIVQETLQGIANVKSFTNEAFEVARYRKSMRQVVELSIKSGRYRGLFISVLMFAIFAAIVFVVWYGISLMHTGNLSFGDLTAFVIYTAFVGGSMAGFADMFAQIQKSLGATQRVRELLVEMGEDVEVEAMLVYDKFEGDIDLQSVVFAYPNRPNHPVLNQISFTIKKGQMVALVGSSGSGKSTIVSLLLNYYQPQDGVISIDGKSIADYSLSHLRSQIGVVPQDVLLFGGTIYENILYGNIHASEDEVVEAAKKANAHSFISSFPEGYQTVVGERGVQLSGGQRQRIAIARAILKNPSILILDEATSALDSESEVLVQEALDNLMVGRTTLVIAHRLSTIRKADNIVVIQHGKIIEEGTHTQLINKMGGFYAYLSAMQSDGFVE